LKKHEYQDVRVEDVGKLNDLGGQGWRVVPGVLLHNSWVLMEREVIAPLKSAMGFTGP
jgi:hypothetical protein